jgi:hypothetical protein
MVKVQEQLWLLVLQLWMPFLQACQCCSQKRCKE